MFTSFLTNLTSTLTACGLKTATANPYFLFGSLYDTLQVGGNAQQVNTVGGDTNWYSSYFWISNNVAGTTVGGITNVLNFAWNICEVDVIAGPLGATNLIVMTNSGTAYTTAFSINANSATTKGIPTLWTNPAGPQQLNLALAEYGTGTNAVVNMGMWNNTVFNGLIMGIQCQNGSTVSNEVLHVPSANTAPIYAAWQPDIILWEDIEASFGQTDFTMFTTNMQNWVRFYFNQCPNTAVVLCGTYPTIPAGPAIWAQNMVIFTNAQLFANQGLPVSYYDGYTPFENTNVMNSRGFFASAQNDGIHITSQGMTTYGYFLWRWFGLCDAQSIQNNYSGTFTGKGSGITTNVSVSGLTFYITNGLIMQVSGP